MRLSLCLVCTGGLIFVCASLVDFSTAAKGRAMERYLEKRRLLILARAKADARKGGKGGQSSSRGSRPKVTRLRNPTSSLSKKRQRKRIKTSSSSNTKKPDPKTIQTIRKRNKSTTRRGDSPNNKSTKKPKASKISPKRSRFSQQRRSSSRKRTSKSKSPSKLSSNNNTSRKRALGPGRSPQQQQLARTPSRRLPTGNRSSVSRHRSSSSSSKGGVPNRKSRQPPFTRSRHHILRGAAAKRRARQLRFGKKRRRARGRMLAFKHNTGGAAAQQQQNSYNNNNGVAAAQQPRYQNSGAVIGRPSQAAGVAANQPGNPNQALSSYGHSQGGAGGFAVSPPAAGGQHSSSGTGSNPFQQQNSASTCPANFDQNCWTRQPCRSVSNIYPFARDTPISCDQCLALCLSKINAPAPYNCKAAVYDSKYQSCDLFASGREANSLVMYPTRDFFLPNPSCATGPLPTNPTNPGGTDTTATPDTSDSTDSPTDSTTEAAVTEPVEICENGQLPKYVKIEGYEPTNPNGEVFNLDSEGECEDFCNLNENPDSGSTLECRSFFFDTAANTCFISPDNTDTAGAVDLTVNEDVIFYEKVCLDEAIVNRCPDPIFRAPEKILIGFAEALVTADSFDECLNQCVNAQDDLGIDCISGAYYASIEEENCILNTESRDTRPDEYIEEPDDVDYFETGC